METTTKQTTWGSQHTAGHDVHGHTAIYDETTGKDIAIVYDGDAHAKLIAEAPAMLRTLELALAHLNTTDATHDVTGRKVDTSMLRDRIQVVVRKAKGRL